MCKIDVLVFFILRVLHPGKFSRDFSIVALSPLDDLRGSVMDVSVADVFVSG